jgi:hypothetical protein
VGELFRVEIGNGREDRIAAGLAGLGRLHTYGFLLALSCVSANFEGWPAITRQSRHTPELAGSAVKAD